MSKRQIIHDYCNINFVLLCLGLERCFRKLHYRGRPDTDTQKSSLPMGDDPNLCTA